MDDEFHKKNRKELERFLGGKQNILQKKDDWFLWLFDDLHLQQPVGARSNQQQSVATQTGSNQ